MVLLVIGLWRHSQRTRGGGLAVLVVTAIKVFRHDLWQLGAPYRVGSVVGLAVSLLAVSALLQWSP